MQIRKVVINTCFGGFSLSGQAWQMYCDRKGISTMELATWEVPRDDSDLIAIVEELGRKADGAHARLKVVEIPADVEWHIAEYDGQEHIAEKHRTWW